jgi:hypothetical protein
MSYNKDWSIKKGLIGCLGVLFFFYNLPLLFVLFIFKAGDYELYSYNALKDEYYLAEDDKKFYILISIGSTVIYLIIWLYISNKITVNI